MTIRAKGVKDEADHFYGIRFNCPGCNRRHVIPVDRPPAGRTLSAIKTDRWTWNRSFDFPTLAPSVHIKPTANNPRCHSFVRDGRIQFLADCEHALAGQTVDLPEIE